MKAFPTEHAVAGTMDLKADGMDLRDYFAAHAPDVPPHFDRKKITQSVINESIKDGKKWFEPGTITRTESDFDRMIRWRYEYADGMMKAREL